MICAANNGDMLSKGGCCRRHTDHCVPTTRQSNSRRGPYPGSRPLNLDRLLGNNRNSQTPWPMISAGNDTQRSGRERVSSSHPTTHPGVSAQARKPARQVDGAAEGHGLTFCGGLGGAGDAVEPDCSRLGSTRRHGPVAISRLILSKALHEFSVSSQS